MGRAGDGTQRAIRLGKGGRLRGTQGGHDGQTGMDARVDECGRVHQEARGGGVAHALPSAPRSPALEKATRTERGGVALGTRA